MASPRLTGNTVELLKPFISALQDKGHEVKYITLADKNILPCRCCYTCQQINAEYGCSIEDDVPAIMDSIIESECVVLATPIYSWFCTAPMKALLDRHYGLNKYYGSAQGSLWQGKNVAIIATHGYKAAYACDPFVMAIQRLCKHSKLNYIGLYSVRDENDIASFKTTEAIYGAREFAHSLIKEINSM